jgi:subfamily B ATP-binding cassette protein MsbA
LETLPDIVNCENPKTLETPKDCIEYKDVCFEYEKGKTVLDHINLKIKIGETVAFVGNSGGGKSTMVNLLPRFYDVTSGQILIDGQDIREMDMNSLRSQIAIVFQDNFLFGGTIKDNILLGKEDATEEELNKAVKAACLEEFINTLDKGLDTAIGERGVLLSGGQKQRIAIARAFLKNAPIVILDEATSALDNKSEAIVQQAIENLMSDRTVFVIAHRLSTVRHADKIVVVNYGKIAEIGTHEELIEKENGIYASLYKTQLK